MSDLNGKIAIVTGASRGIGRAIALELANCGAAVVINYRRDAESAEEVVNEVIANDGVALSIQADVSQKSDAERLVSATIERFGQVDILVNNAGTTRDRLLMRMSEDEWDAVIETNLKSVFNCSQAVIRPMLRRKQGGRIINISSVVGLLGASGQTNYAASKAAIHGFTRSLAKEVGARNITVNAVAPGLFLTDLTADLPESAVEQYNNLTPLGRLGELSEIAPLVSFLASEKAAYITGEIIRIDGGLGIGT